MEATNITIHSATADALSESEDKNFQSLAQVLSQKPDIPVGEERNITIQDFGKRGDKIRRVFFHLRLQYSDRNNGNPYDETTCFYTSKFDVAKDNYGFRRNLWAMNPIGMAVFSVWSLSLLLRG